MSMPRKRARGKQRAKFALLVVTIASIWLLALPRLGRTTPMRKMIDRNQAASIDPSALFYTDLEHLHYDRGLLRRER